MIDGQSRSSPSATIPPRCYGTVAGPADAMVPPTPAPAPPGADPDLWRRRISHDIRHELGTIIMLASAVSVSDDVGPASRKRVDALLGETRWLDHLLRRLDEHDDRPEGLPSPERVRVDELVGEIVAGLRLASIRLVGYTPAPAWAHIEPLALWRAVRNILDNACRVAGERVEVSVACQDGWTVVQVDDDGPGFGGGAGGLASLGLGIVHDLVSGYGGGLEVTRCELGGARVRILLPSAAGP
jgi:signal transduction histidine kinase